MADLDAEIEAVFGPRAELARRYVDLLVGDGIVRGMIGPREAERIWPRHIFNSTAVVGLIAPDAEVVDLGSGAGLPGIPIALARPDLQVSLLEPMARRVRFLEDVLVSLGVPALSIQHRRAEAADSSSADIVVARAVAPLVRLVDLTFAILRPGGRLLALKGEAAAAEAEQLEQRGGWGTTIHQIEVYGGTATVVEVRRASND
jgi:16S rRNA (guanine527-N7)-methyltransferase